MKFVVVDIEPNGLLSIDGHRDASVIPHDLLKGPKTTEVEAPVSVARVDVQRGRVSKTEMRLVGVGRDVEVVKTVDYM